MSPTKTFRSVFQMPKVCDFFDGLLGLDVVLKLDFDIHLECKVQVGIIRYVMRHAANLLIQPKALPYHRESNPAKSVAILFPRLPFAHDEVPGSGCFFMMISN